MLINVDLFCSGCEGKAIHTLDNKEDTWAMRWECECGGELRRVMSAPAIKRVSHLDGNGRFAAIKKANLIERDAMDLPHSQRGEMMAEARKIKSIKN